MQESIQKMMGTALIIMIVVLFFVFKVRWRLLPLLIVLIAVIGTVGLMGWLQIPITMVSMAVFPILIGLGIDYGIQFHNRYAEEMAEEDAHE
jgi:predicted RND superfamily exporter protein